MKLSLALIAIVILGTGCKHSTGPIPDNNPRGYRWTIDTLHLDPGKYPGPWQNLLQSIWGTANDLYAVGWSDGSAGTMWHFDGNKWSNVKLGLFEGGSINAPYALASIHGLAPNDIYAVGQRWGPTVYGRSFIIHYDGKQWKEQQTPEGYGLLSVWANAANDIWACGVQGTILHCDGAQWTKDSVTFTIPEGSQYNMTSIARSQGIEMFMLATAYQTSPSFSRWDYYFFRRQAGVWRLSDTFEINSGQYSSKWGGSYLVVLPSGQMYSTDYYGVFQWTDGGWKSCYLSVKNIQTVFGTRQDNLFITGAHGFLAHYNGGDWYEYTYLSQPNAIYAGGWADDNQAFVLGWVDGENTVVLHGR